MSTPSKGVPTISVTIMNLQLEDKTALVSGSSQGIGFAIAEALAKEGAAVVINSNKQDLVDEAIGKISKTAPGAHLDRKSVV